MASPEKDRRRIRSRLKVIHRHRNGDREPAPRESELTFMHGRPVAILEWIDIGGVRTPVFVCHLDKEKLHRAKGADTFYYDDVTIDPRYEDL